MEIDYPELSQLPETHTKICAKLLSEHKQVRELELRAGVALKGLEKGKANLEASIAYLRGELQEPECVHCSEKRSGPFRRCVVLKDHFGGSCTNCRYNEEQTRCSLRDRSKKGIPATPRREARLMRHLGKAGGKPPTSTFERLVQDASRMTRQERLQERKDLELRVRALTKADEMAFIGGK